MDQLNHTHDIFIAEMCQGHNAERFQRLILQFKTSHNIHYTIFDECSVRNKNCKIAKNYIRHSKELKIKKKTIANRLGVKI